MTDVKTARPVVLAILDGWGIAPHGPGNAITRAHTPTYDRLWSNYPAATLKTSGLDAGLSDGQMGNSEVGHMNLGAGFIVNQMLTRIDLAIQDRSFFSNETLSVAIRVANEKGSRVHLMGLVSDGGVHSHISHLKALLEMCKEMGAGDVLVHAFLDGRDTSPLGGVEYLTDLQESMQMLQTGRVASIVGRYYAMDRDNRWERTRVAHDLLVSAEGAIATDAVVAVHQKYDEGITDEFMTPIVVQDHLGRSSSIIDGDVVIMFNFRTDRGRQLTRALTGQTPVEADFPLPPGNLHVVTLTEYDPDIRSDVAFDAQTIEFPLARVLSDAGLSQFHTAETEKYAHVTYFFNGGQEAPFSGETREMVPSPKVATYDLQPEMSATGVADMACRAIASGTYDFVVLNFANCDMVGHTGVMDAAISATEAVDRQLERVVNATLESGGVALVTADHGNAEQMYESNGESPMTAHTTNPVPVILVAPDESPLRDVVLNDGRLADVAPTVLHILGVDQPESMTGRSLIANDNDQT